MLRQSDDARKYKEWKRIQSLQKQLTELQQRHADFNQDINALRASLVNSAMQIQVTEYAAEEAELNIQLEHAQKNLSAYEKQIFDAWKDYQDIKLKQKKAEEAFNNGEPVNFEHLHRSGAARALDYPDSDSE